MSAERWKPFFVGNISRSSSDSWISHPASFVLCHWESGSSRLFQLQRRSHPLYCEKRRRVCTAWWGLAPQIIHVGLMSASLASGNEGQTVLDPCKRHKSFVMNYALEYLHNIHFWESSQEKMSYTKLKIMRWGKFGQLPGLKNDFHQDAHQCLPQQLIIYQFLTTMTGKSKRCDICIIGSGPAGLCVLSAVHEPYTLDTMTWTQVSISTSKSEQYFSFQS